MEEIKVPIMEHGRIVREEIEKVYSVSEYYVSDYLYKLANSAPVEYKKRVQYINIANSFDIETSLLKHQDPPRAFMYHGQFCINNDLVVFFRRWEEFQYFMDLLRKNLFLSGSRKLVIYVHNLAYEFQFMKNFMKITDYFFRKERKPIYIESDGIQFRCSYFLSNMSLSKFLENTENVKHKKLDGDEFDYSRVRTPDSKLYDFEKAYCYCDVKGLTEAIAQRLTEDTIASIPLTSTGYVRRDCRQNMAKDELNKLLFIDTRLNSTTYKMCKDAFAGGVTHASIYTSGQIIEDVDSWDRQSSYPYELMYGMFPIGKFNTLSGIMPGDKVLDSDFEFAVDHTCAIFDITFTEFRLKNEASVSPVSVSKCKNLYNPVDDNGRLIYAAMVTIRITQTDYTILRDIFDWDKRMVTNLIFAKKGKLPKEFREVVMKYYKLKTELKGISGSEYEYMKAKNRLNALFGMLVTDIQNDEIEYRDDLRFNDRAGWNREKQEIEAALKKYYFMSSGFLPYQWGTWTTANARRSLYDGILTVPRDYMIYTDTDSIKNRKCKKVATELKKINKKIIEQCESSDIKGYALDKMGKKRYLGIWEEEDGYEKFKTLGAKKYAYISRKDHELHITVSGMGKKAAKEVGTLENFAIGNTFYDAGRTVSYYNEEEIHEIEVMGSKFTTASNVAIVNTTYTLGVTDTYREILDHADDFRKNGVHYIK